MQLPHSHEKTLSDSAVDMLAPHSFAALKADLSVNGLKIRLLTRSMSGTTTKAIMVASTAEPLSRVGFAHLPKVPSFVLRPVHDFASRTDHHLIYQLTVCAMKRAFVHRNSGRGE